MKYIIISIEEAAKIGLMPDNHLRKGNNFIINQSELMNNRKLEGSLEERVEKVNAKMYSNIQIRRIIKKQRYGI